MKIINTKFITDSQAEDYYQDSFDEISEIILREEYLDILENPSKENQMIFIVRINDYTYVVPFIIDDNENIILKTAYPSRKFNKIYGAKS